MPDIAEERRDQEADIYERFNEDSTIVVDTESYDSVVVEIWKGSNKVKTIEVEDCGGVFNREIPE